MNSAFPVRESTIFSLSELASRVLGLLFLAKFVDAFGLPESGQLRTVLPVIGIACAVGTVGIPQALTRLLSATDAYRESKIYRDHILASFVSTVVSMVLTLGLLLLMLRLSTVEGVGGDELLPLLAMSAPLLLITCVSGSLRGIFLGMGRNYTTAASQMLEAAVRLLLVVYLADPGARPHLSGGQAGILMITISEGLSLLYLVAASTFLLWTHRLRVVARDVGWRLRMKTWWTVGRMSVSPTMQSLFASAGYALELPLASHFLALSYGEHTADVMIAEYAAVAVPLLCAPMFVTDGMSTALLPVMTAQREAFGSKAVQRATYNTVRAVAMVSIPAMAALYVLSPILCQWFGARSAAPILCWLAPLTLPLYLQAPIASLLQAQGRGRALLYASFYGDIVRIGSVYLFLSVWHFGTAGLLGAFAVSVVVQTAQLLWMAVRESPIPVPWRTLCHSLFAGIVMSAELVYSVHAPRGISFWDQPFAWAAFGAATGLIYLVTAGEVTPRALHRVPIVGRFVGRTAEGLVSRMTR